MLPQILLDIKDVLQTNVITPCTKYKEGRSNSFEDEASALEIITKKFGKRIRVLSARSWADVELVQEETVFNIKSTSCKSSDNGANFAALRWIFTPDDIPLNSKGNACVDSNRILDLIEENSGPVDVGRDYYFLILNKLNPSEVIVNSLKGITHYSVNPSNLPIQIHWGNFYNSIYIPKTSQEVWNKMSPMLENNMIQEWKLRWAKRNQKEYV